MDYSFKKKRWTPVIGVMGLVLGLMLAVPHQAQALLVTNGDFETGDFTGWTLVDPVGFDAVVTNPVNDGFFAASLGANTPTDGFGTLSQTIATTPSASYTLAFYLSNYNGAAGVIPPNNFQVNWDGGTLLGGNLVDVPGQPYTLYTFSVVATGSSTNLEFKFFNSNAFFLLDDVSLTASSAPVAGPASLILVGLGLVAVGGLGWKRNRK